jgi:putative component of membrane protein insertase Oxa1/YidC/SpoIIIJ protein YidD
MHYILVLLIFLQAPKETNPVTVVINTGILIHQKLIAPAQGDVCNFSPSCSHFGREAFSKYGPLWGSLMTADRLMRCNPWAYQYSNTYYSGVKNYKIYDPAENNFILRKIQKRPGIDKKRLCQ